MEAARRMAGLLYTALKIKTAYGPRPWKGVRNDPAHVAGRR
jgi:hypothetical protein